MEVLCKQLYEATEPTERTAAEKALVDFSDRPDCLQKCLMLLEQGTVSDFAKNFFEIVNFTVELYSRHLFLDCLRSTCCCYNVNKINFKTVCRGIRWRTCATALVSLPHHKNVFRNESIISFFRKLFIESFSNTVKITRFCCIVFMSSKMIQKQNIKQKLFCIKKFI